MALTGHQEAIELLLIEEADAWFEYLEATTAPSRGTATWRSSRGRGRRLSQRLRADPGTAGKAPAAAAEVA